MNTYKKSDLVISSGDGTWLKDVNGNKYLDFVAGIAVNSLGHNHPIIVKAIKKQADKLLHVSNLYWTKEQGNLAKKLIDLSDHSSIFFCNSGSEAVEGALKTARKYGKSKQDNKCKIICFNQSFHGRTMGALSVTGQEKYRSSFGPLIDDIIYCDFNDLASVKENISDDVCSIIVEPIQGEGGIIPAEQKFLKGLKEICEDNDMLLIFDEIQCGVGRTGSFYAYKHFDVIPDIVCMAKGLGGGVPIGAFIANSKADVLTYGDHGSTFGGNPLVSAVSYDVVNHICTRDFLKEVNDKSDYLLNELNKLKVTYPIIKEIRGVGLMLGVEVGISSKTIVENALSNKLLIISAGENIIRIVPPLTVSYYEIDLFIEKLELSIKEAA
jgi:acetylornithine/N-succinyldiaminopimelate aminotransferase